MSTKDIEKMSTKELAAELAKRKAAEQELEAQRREQYEQERDELINRLGDFALEIALQMGELKYVSMTDLTTFRHKMLEYGKLRRKEHNKGSFEIKNDRFKIIFTTQVNKRFDERAKMGETKLREFLQTMVKPKTNHEAYQLIISLLERNTTTGDYDIDLINRLYKMENAYDHVLWKEAIKLFKESYSPVGTAQYVRFFKRNQEANTWEPINLDFAKTKSDANAVEEPEASEA